jgi:uncharacterized OsmC-like protein
MLETAPRPRVNGIDLASLDETLDRIRSDSSCAKATFRVTTEWKGQARSETVVESYTLSGDVVPRNFTIVADEPMELMGTNSAPNPQELLMAAVNSCLIVGYVYEAANRGVALDDCRIEMEGELDLRGFLGLDEGVPPGSRRINYVVTLDGDGSREQYEEIHQAVMATSPNFFNMAQPIQMCGRLA